VIYPKNFAGDLETRSPKAKEASAPAKILPTICHAIFYDLISGSLVTQLSHAVNNNLEYVSMFLYSRIIFKDVICTVETFDM
jgi:hypothetical protein